MMTHRSHYSRIIISIVVLCVGALLAWIYYLSSHKHRDSLEDIEDLLLLSDPEVREEVEFLYQNSSIDFENYKRMIQSSRDDVIYSYDKRENGEVITIESYFVGKAGTIDGSMRTRASVQEAMRNTP